jgi:alcohol dehydrogenase class IV
MSEPTLFMTPERVIFGRGASGQIGSLFKELGSSKVFVVTDKIVAGLKAFQAIRSALEEQGLSHFVYDGVDANPTDVQVDGAAGLYRSEKADALLAVGGGSSMDTAKAVGITIANGGSIRDYEIQAQEDIASSLNIQNPIPPLMTVPTTSGTGAEVSAWAVVTQTEKNYKFFPGGWQALPKIALVDPLMTVSMPPQVTAGTGMDALCHAIEAVTSPYAIPQTDLYAFSAIERIVASIGPAVANGENLDAREQMSLAAMEAGLSMNAWCGGVHALGHQLSTQYGMAHGMAMGLMMPYVMRFNLMACPDLYARIARALGESTGGMSVLKAAKMAPAAVLELVDMLGLPTNLKAYGADPNKIAECTRWASVDTDLLGNPRGMSPEQIEQLFHEAFEAFEN